MRSTKYRICSNFKKLTSVSPLGYVDIPVPTKVIRKILRRNALESAHPAFEPRIVCVDVVDVDRAARLVFRMRWHDPQGDLIASVR